MFDAFVDQPMLGRDPQHADRIAVVIAGWSGREPHHLVKLCQTITRHSAGADYDLVLCANGTDYRLPPEVSAAFSHVFIRENTGFNLGAWDHAWRQLPQHRWFLFLQDDCTVFRRHWLRAMLHRFKSVRGCGLVGEYLNRDWDRPWTELADPRGGFEFAEAAGRYFRALAEWGVPPGETAIHLTTVVQFTSRDVLEKVDGYHIVGDHSGAIAAEIAFSRKVAALGGRLVQLGRHRHSWIAHPQWPSNSLTAKLAQSFRKRFRNAPKG